jgi:Flp pilus assembly protein TadD
LALSPDNRNALVLRAAAMQGLGRFSEATTLLSNLKTRYPNAPGLDAEIGFLDLRENKLAEAEKVFRRRYQPGSEDLRPLVGLIRTLEAGKRSAEAQRILEVEVAKSPNRPAVQLMLAEEYAASGNLEKSMPILEQLVAAHPEMTLAQLRLGDLQVRKGDMEHGIASLQKARDLAPRSVEPVLLLADAQQAAQRLEDAKRNYRAALKLDEGNLKALNNLAFLIADTGGGLDEALKLASEASQKAPKQPNIADTMGYVYLKMRNNATALHVFANLAKQYPANPTFRYHHGLALIETGNKAAAKLELQAALADKPGVSLVAKIKEALGRTG